MTKPIILVRQAAGLGDIFFLQYAANYLAYKNKAKVLWPILPHLLFLKDYLYSVWGEDVEYISTEDDFPLKTTYDDSGVQKVTEASDVTYVPFHNPPLSSRGIMKSKYELIGLPWQNWRMHFAFKRSRLKEKELFHNVLGIKVNEPFALVNSNWCTPPDVRTVQNKVAILPGLKLVEMRIIPGYTIFDWCKVIEEATQIVTVDTCLNYIIDVLPVKADKLTMTLRSNRSNFFHTEGLFAQPWEYV